MKKLLFTIVVALFYLSSFGQWSSQASGTSNGFTSVYFTDANNGYATTSSNEIFNTTNAGVSWSLQYTASNILYSVHFGSINKGSAVGFGGATFRSTDAGATWNLASSGQGNNLFSVYYIDADTGYTVGNNGTLLKTVNAGAFWSPKTSGTANPLYSVYFTDPNNGYAVGATGTILKTVDAGYSWTTQVSGTTLTLASVYFTDANTGFASGASGIILKTTNAGSTWFALNSGTANNLNSIRFANANTGFASGDLGTILKTNDAGSTWYTQTSTTTNNLYSVIFTDANNGYTVGAGGIILKTVDGGCATPNVTISGTNTICNFSSTALTANGASTYVWSANAGSVTTGSVTVGPSTNTLYSVIGTSTDGCIDTGFVNVAVNPLPSITATQTNTSCYAVCDGQTTASGAVSYIWSPGGMNTATISGLCAAVYTVTGTDINGCSNTSSSTVTEPPILVATISSYTNASCVGVNNGEIIASGGGGTGAFTYLWMPGGMTTDTIFNLGAGNYTVTITDAMSCNTSTVQNIFAPTMVYPIINNLTNLCQGQQGQLFYSMSCGNPPYTASWYDYATTTTFCSLDTSLLTPLISGPDTVMVTITDNGGCIGTDIQVIQVGYGDSLSGIITEPNTNPVTSGQVFLFKQKSSNVGVYDTVGVSLIQPFGKYSFPNIFYGDYFLKAIADTNVGFYPTSVGTYYSPKPNAYQWDSAMVINHYTCNASNVGGYTVAIIEIVPTPGPGLISGIITAGAGYGQRSGPGAQILGAPLKGVDVKLGKNPGGSPAARTTTDNGGNYSFPNIALGAYRIYVDIPNYGMDSVLDVVLTSTNTTSGQNNYYVDSLMVRVDTASGIGIIQIKGLANDLLIYPNPNNGIINLKSHDEIGIVSIYNSLGEIIYKEKINSTQHQIDFGKQSSGIYFLHSQQGKIKILKE